MNPPSQHTTAYSKLHPLNVKQFYALHRSPECQQHPSNCFYKNRLFYLGTQEPLFQQLNWTELARRRQLYTVNMVYKCTCTLAPEYLQNRFVGRVSNCFLTGSSNKFVVPPPLTKYLKNSFRYSGAVLRNSLPSALRQAESIHGFESGCREFFE